MTSTLWQLAFLSLAIAHHGILLGAAVFCALKVVQCALECVE